MVSPRRGFAPSLRFVWWHEQAGAAGGGGRPRASSAGGGGVVWLLKPFASDAAMARA